VSELKGIDLNKSVPRPPAPTLDLSPLKNVTKLYSLAEVDRILGKKVGPEYVGFA
jgi:hypothetical protein